ncbi:MAG: hypothetical protein HY298_05235 [Verrucomicrobia bacterium]|nr:hypothetical protein [Verrucomicrobiota bacterium]
MKKLLKTCQHGALCVCVVFFLAPFCIQGQLCDPVPSNLVSWWQAEGNAFDANGTNHGTLLGNTAYVPGQVGKAFNFDGSGDAVQIGNPASLQLQNFTIDAWIKRSSTTQASLSAGGGQGFVSDGSGDAVQVGNPLNLQQGFTIEAWIKRANASLATFSGDTDESATNLPQHFYRAIIVP